MKETVEQYKALGLWEEWMDRIAEPSQILNEPNEESQEKMIKELEKEIERFELEHPIREQVEIKSEVIGNGAN